MTAKPWESFSLDSQLAKQLISSQFRQFDRENLTLTLLGVGWDNVCFLTQDNIVFRFPRREIAVTLLLNEINLLPALKQHISIPIPELIYIGTPTNDYPWPFAGYKLLSGETADQCSLTRNERLAYVGKLAKFMAELHSVNTTDLQMPLDLMGRLDPQIRLPKIEEYLDKIDELKFLDTKALRKFSRHFKLQRPIAVNCLVHGDLYARHILIDSQKYFSGVIDWGDAHSGDAASDLALAHSFLPPESHAEFKSHYGVIDDDIWELAKFRAICSSATISVYGHDIKDEKLFKEGLQGLLFINETLV